MLDPTERPVATLPDAETLERALGEAAEAVRETRRILVGATAAHALALADACRRDLEEARELAGRIAASKPDTAPVWCLESRARDAARHERDARYYARAYAKLLARFAE